jgi:hypothetical protein
LIAAAGMVNEHYLMPSRRGGSSKKHMSKFDRDRDAGHLRLYKYYFDPINPIFRKKALRHLYGMYRELFLVISQWREGIR